MAKTVCKILGVVLLLVGVAGFAATGLTRRPPWTGTQCSSPCLGSHRPLLWLCRNVVCSKDLLPCFRRGLSRAGDFGIRTGHRGRYHVDGWSTAPGHSRSRYSRPAGRNLSGRWVVD